MPSRTDSRAQDAWSPLDFDQEAFRAGANEQSFRRFARQGVRTLHVHEGGSGTSDTVHWDDDLLLTVINCVMPRTARWRYDTDEALIMLRASLCCDVAFEVGSAAPLIFNRPEVTLVCLPKGRPQTVDIAGGTRQQGMVAIFRAAAFPARYGLQLSDLPPLVRDAVTGSAEVGRIASFPLDHRIAALLADTIDTRLDGEMRVVQYAGRLAELVAYTLDAMQHTPLLRGSALNRQRDVELAHAAMQRLERDYRKPATLRRPGARDRHQPEQAQGRVQGSLRRDHGRPLPGAPHARGAAAAAGGHADHRAGGRTGGLRAPEQLCRGLQQPCRHVAAAIPAAPCALQRAAGDRRRPGRSASPPGLTLPRAAGRRGAVPIA